MIEVLVDAKAKPMLEQALLEQGMNKIRRYTATNELWEKII